MNNTFRTAFNIPKPPFKLSATSNTLLLGSCFSDSIGDILSKFKTNTLSNPFGTLFHPLAIFDAIDFAFGSKQPNPLLVTESYEVWYHYQFHSNIKALSPSSLAENVQQTIANTQAFTKNCDTIILTLGSAFVYRLLEQDALVANCHKTPQKAFSKELLSIETIVNRFKESYNASLRDKKVILTVSPVRHIKDSISLNSVSKSILRLACHELSETHENVYYFPSFEIMNDDLRDYRFYKEDLIHPNEIAIKYIWNAFLSTFYSKEDEHIFSKIERINNSLQHRPFNIESLQHQQFLKLLLVEMELLGDQFNFAAEIEHVKSQLV